MKRRTVATIFLIFLAINSFGRKKYILTKDDFIAQFNETYKVKKIFCQNEIGEKVWLYANLNTILSVTTKDKKKQQLLLQTINLREGKIEGFEFNIWAPTQKISLFDLNDVSSFYVEQKYQEYERPYFDEDSCRNLVRLRNDSIRNQNTNQSHNSFLIFKNDKNRIDTIKIIEDACYNFTFSDGTKTEYGVVQEISQDSIFVSNYFNSLMAEKADQSYKVLRYSINNLKSIDLLKSGGYSYKKVEVAGTFHFVQNEKRSSTNIPYWFAMDPMTGEVNFYRLLQTNKGYSGIKEKNGKIIWYEGEPTQ